MKWSPILTLMPQMSQIQYLSITMGLGSKWVTHIYLLMWKDIRKLFDVFNSIGDKVGIWVLSLFCHNFGIPIIFNFILVKTTFEFFAYQFTMRYKHKPKTTKTIHVPPTPHIFGTRMGILFLFSWDWWSTKMKSSNELLSMTLQSWIGIWESHKYLLCIYYTNVS
jgi:hypothetical protein